MVDLLRMPLEGLTKGPGSFLSGITQGFSSLLWHTSSGKGFFRDLLKVHQDFKSAKIQATLKVTNIESHTTGRKIRRESCRT